MKRLILCLALLFAAPPALAQEEAAIEAEVARIIMIAHDTAPYRDWDALRRAMPRSVNWHLVPPDDPEAQVFRRSGWMSIRGRSAGIAACGPARGPELLTLRMHAAAQDEASDPVLVVLRARNPELRRLPTSDERELFGFGGAGAALFERQLDCTPEGARASRSCSVSYVIDVRPDVRSAPAVRACRAP